MCSGNCYSTNLPATSTFYSIYVNGVPRPRANYIFLGHVAARAYGRLITSGTPFPAGLPNTVLITYTNVGVQLEDTRTFVVDCAPATLMETA